MLIEFKFRNFRSFKNEVSFLMTAVRSFNEHNDDNLIKLNNQEFDLVKSAAIYGLNAGGKSNFIYAMAFMIYTVHESFSNSLKQEEDRPNNDNQFKLSKISENAEMMFEVSFLLQNHIFRYGFEIVGNEITKEWLYKKNERETPLFVRENGNFEINRNAFKEGLKYKNDVNQNVLFISHLAQNNQDVSKLIYNWFSNVKVISGLTESTYSKYTERLLRNDEKFRSWISLALKYMEITNIETGENEGEIFTYHNLYDENNLLIGSVPFKVKERESHGTRKLILILGPIYDALKNGRILFIDELDSRFHPNLSKKILELFNHFNQQGAQLIFTGHDVSLLSKDLLRRDQVWFVNKNQFGISEIYSLSDFNSKTVRNTSAFDKKFLENKFGASDTIEISEKLLNILYGKE